MNKCGTHEHKLPSLPLSILASLMENPILSTKVPFSEKKREDFFSRLKELTVIGSGLVCCAGHTIYLTVNDSKDFTKHG